MSLTDQHRTVFSLTLRLHQTLVCPDLQALKYKADFFKFWVRTLLKSIRLLWDRVYQPLIVKSSFIGIISNSSFTNNGNSTLTAGGAISMSDSKISIINSKFINNIAISGGAISFECTSLDSCNLNINTTTLKFKSCSKSRRSYLLRLQ